MKFIIEENEVNRILSMHQSLKEQTAPVTKTVKEQLQEFIDNGCVKDGKVVPMKSTNPNKQFSIKKESVRNPGKVIYLFLDYTYGSANSDGTSFQMGTEKWACNTTNMAKTAADAKAAQEKSDQDKKSSTTNLELTKTEGGWKERKDITDTDANVNNPQMYEKQVLNGVTLYRSKASAGITSGLTEDQKSIITTWQGKGYKLRKDLTPEEAKTWKEVVVSPTSDGYFSQDFKMFFDPTTLTKGVGTGETKVSLTTVIQNAVANRIPTDKKDCKQTIEAYYISFKKKRPLEPNEFDALKTKTQACKNEFYGDWGALLSGGKKVDDILDVMSGVKSGGPSSYGEDSKWRLQ